MSTVTAPPMRTAAPPAAPYRRTFARALRSEWIKLATVRSTWWSIGIVAVLTIGIALLVAQAMDVPGFEPIQAVVAPIQFTVLLAGILGAISVTGEYSSGMIRSTLAANPSRGAVLIAKATIVAVLMFVSSLIIFTIAALVVTPVFAGRDMPFAWDDPAKSILPILAASLSMAVFALIGVAFGFLIRSGAGAIAATVGLLFVLPIVASVFTGVGAGWEWITDVAARLPMAASQSAILPQDDWGLSGVESYATLAAWVVAGILAAWAALRTRDA
ncbi:ABC transporter permease [Microbacterium sp.]|uniref:ABC transporter permease n=1 Tax=Microbacterium sp. TaxID=51671 RepID=UPI003F962E55